MDYMTAGELAQSVGITLRTVQYYDQLGLLRPSQHGPNNLRLYTSEDQQQLYRILVLKYLGLSLSQIRQTLDDYNTNDALADLVKTRIDAVEAEFHDLFKRLQALNEIKGELATLPKPDWQRLAATVETVQDQGSLIWQMIAMIDDGSGASAKDALSRREYLIRLHELFGEAVGLMKANEPLTSGANRDFARRARELLETPDGRAGQSVLVMGNTFHSSASHLGFDQLSRQVMDFIQSVIDANESAREEESGQ